MKHDTSYHELFHTAHGVQSSRDWRSGVPSFEEFKQKHRQNEDLELESCSIDKPIITGNAQSPSRLKIVDKACTRISVEFTKNVLNYLLGKKDWQKFSAPGVHVRDFKKLLVTMFDATFGARFCVTISKQDSDCIRIECYASAAQISKLRPGEEGDPPVKICVAHSNDWEHDSDTIYYILIKKLSPDMAEAISKSLEPETLKEINFRIETAKISEDFDHFTGKNKDCGRAGKKALLQANLNASKAVSVQRGLTSAPKSTSTAMIAEALECQTVSKKKNKKKKKKGGVADKNQDLTQPQAEILAGKEDHSTTQNQDHLRTSNIVEGSATSPPQSPRIQLESMSQGSEKQQPKQSVYLEAEIGEQGQKEEAKGDISQTSKIEAEVLSIPEQTSFRVSPPARESKKPNIIDQKSNIKTPTENLLSDSRSEVESNSVSPTARASPTDLVLQKEHNQVGTYRKKTCLEAEPCATKFSDGRNHQRTETTKADAQIRKGNEDRKLHCDSNYELKRPQRTHNPEEMLRKRSHPQPRHLVGVDSNEMNSAGQDDFEKLLIKPARVTSNDHISDRLQTTSVSEATSSRVEQFENQSNDGLENQNQLLVEKKQATNGIQRLQYRFDSYKRRHESTRSPERGEARIAYQESNKSQEFDRKRAFREHQSGPTAKIQSNFDESKAFGRHTRNSESAHSHASKHEQSGRQSHFTRQNNQYDRQFQSSVRQVGAGHARIDLNVTSRSVESQGENFQGGTEILPRIKYQRRSSRSTEKSPPVEQSESRVYRNNKPREDGAWKPRQVSPQRDRWNKHPEQGGPRGGYSSHDNRRLNDRDWKGGRGGEGPRDKHNYDGFYRGDKNRFGQGNERTYERKQGDVYQNKERQKDWQDRGREERGWRPKQELDSWGNRGNKARPAYSASSSMREELRRESSQHGHEDRHWNRERGQGGYQKSKVVFDGDRFQERNWRENGPRNNGGVRPGNAGEQKRFTSEYFAELDRQISRKNVSGMKERGKDSSHN